VHFDPGSLLRTPTDGSRSARHVTSSLQWIAVRDCMGTAEDTQVRLYELVLENGRSASPFV
jgi:hypothetical protein